MNRNKNEEYFDISDDSLAGVLERKPEKDFSFVPWTIISFMTFSLVYILPAIYQSGVSYGIEQATWHHMETQEYLVERAIRSDGTVIWQRKK